MQKASNDKRPLIMKKIAKLFIPLALLATFTGCALKDPNRASPPLSDLKEGGSRNMYSPDIYGDAYAQQQWSASIEALEAQCRTTGEYCSEARSARASLRNSTSDVTRPAQ